MTAGSDPMTGAADPMTDVAGRKAVGDLRERNGHRGNSTKKNQNMISHFIIKWVLYNIRFILYFAVSQREYFILAIKDIETILSYLSICYILCFVWYKYRT